VATLVDDLVDDLLGRALVDARAVACGSNVVDHDERAVVGQHEGILAADSTARSGDDTNPSITHS
jgi:hypothetical protein